MPIVNYCSIVLNNAKSMSRYGTALLIYLRKKWNFSEGLNRHSTDDSFSLPKPSCCCL